MANVNKLKAVAYRKRGKSYNYISQKLLIPKSTLSDWFGDLKWSQDIKTGLEKEAYTNTLKRVEKWVATNRKKWQDWRERHRFEAIGEYPKFKANSLFTSGLMIYWSEGDNNIESGSTRLTNTDPRMIKIFIDFAIKFCRVDLKKIRLALILYPDLNDTICKNYWIKKTGIPLHQFHKTQFIKGYHPIKRLEYGICMIRVGGVGLKEKIKTWIDLSTKDLIAGVSQW